MTTCSVRWRPSGGRGEFEFVPADTLVDRAITLFIEPLNLNIEAEVYGIHAQGKPRLRKRESNNREKLHLPQLVAAIARMPEPAREDISKTISFPLENKAYILDFIDFDIISDTGSEITLAPLRFAVLHSDFQIDLQDRFTAIARDIINIEDIKSRSIALGMTVQRHAELLASQENTREIRRAADAVINEQQKIFGKTNAGSITALNDANELPKSDLEEEGWAYEGRLLTRIHRYKERDRKLIITAKKIFISEHGGLFCEVCELEPGHFYGDEFGDRAIEAHHKIPVEELQPDSVTRVADLAMVCASCHRVIHARKPCFSPAELRAVIAAASPTA